MTDFLTAAWALRYVFLVGALIWLAAGLAAGPFVGRAIARGHGDEGRWVRRG